VTGIFAQGQDVTEIHKANLALKEADKRKDAFLSMLAHELRNPLAPISAAAEILGLSSDNPMRVLHTSQVIRRQVKHMTGLVDDLLDVSRVTSGLVVLDNVAVDVNVVVSDAMEQMRPNFEKRNQEHYVLHTEAAIHVCGDHKRLVQVLANLLGNASKYTKEFGTISVEINANDENVEISVSDNGIGMDCESIPQMFELFAQGRRSSDRSEGGLGLGLSLVKHLVELHGGKVDATSLGIGLGSRFTISLPVVAAPFTIDIAQCLEKPDLPRTPMKILLVDDNVDAVESLGAIFETLGHQIKTAYGAVSAMELSEANDFDACVLDIGLPDIDGYELVGRMRGMPAMKTTFIIALSGYGQEQDKVLAKEAGFDHYLVKPAIATDILCLLHDRIKNKKIQK
jgi:CheY-like chemotaxis protein